MRLRRAIGLICLGLLVGLWCCGGATANGTVTVTPKVTVDASGGLSILSGAPGGVVDFDHMGTAQTKTETLTLGVSANAQWNLTVTKDTDLTCNDELDPAYGQTIASSNFTYTSNGAMGGSYAATDTEFGEIATPSSVVSDGSAVSNGEVNVVYKLYIPGDQVAAYYTAPVHTYTLVVSS